MKSIYILLTKSDTYVSRAIKMFTSDTYTHASISFNEELQPLYSMSRKYINSPLPAGLRTEPLTQGFFKKYDYIPCALYELKVSDDVYEDARRQVEKMMAEAPSYQFSVMGLFLCGLGIPFHRDRRYFCSEFVSEVLRQSNAICLPKDTSLMRPDDYASLPELICRFEGQLNALLLRFGAAFSAG